MRQTKQVTKSAQSQASVDFKRFEELARRLVSVPKKDIQEREQKDKEEKKKG